MVSWNLSLYSNTMLSGLNFQRSSDSESLGVSNSCHAGENSPVPISGASQLAIKFGYYNDEIYGRSINGIPSAAQDGNLYPYTDAANDECLSSIVVSKAASPRVLYLGT